MQSICSVVALVLAVSGPSESAKTSPGMDHVQVTAGWSPPAQPSSGFAFGLPRTPRLRMPRPRWP